MPPDSAGTGDQAPLVPASIRSPDASHPDMTEPATPQDSLIQPSAEGPDTLPGTASAPADAFSYTSVVQRAQALASLPYSAPAPLEKAGAQLNYDQYRRIQLASDGAIWPDGDSGFRVLPDPRGYLFEHDVRLNLVEDGKVIPHPYTAGSFNFFDLPLPDKLKNTLGFSGFRIVSPLNMAGKFDEVISFRGASFFRALGASTVYGASARALSIGTASPEGEEFPYFTEFWLERPSDNASDIKVYALLDGQSVTGALEFRIEPGPETLVDVHATFFPRRDLNSIGIAPMSSMYFFSPHDLRKHADDYRPAVHDSEGLAIHFRNGEWAWRPLSNPQSLQVSILATEAPRGFGLLQRKRDFDDYADIEAQYDRRPNVWIAPSEDWGEGKLTLVEIPTANEYNDNIVAFWRPAAPWKAGESYDISYRMHWSLMQPAHPQLIEVSDTLAGTSLQTGRPMFVIDYEAANPELLNGAEVSVSTSSGKVSNAILRTNPETGKSRLSFELEPQDAQIAELRALLTISGKPVTETWLYRWRPE